MDSSNHSDPVWLQWINPKPVDDEEVAKIEAALREVIETVEDLNYLDTEGPRIIPKLRLVKEHLDAVALLLESLPDHRIFNDSEKAKGWKASIETVNLGVAGLIKKDEDWLASEIAAHGPLPLRKAGRPEEEGKRGCVLYVYETLKSLGKRHGMHQNGPVANLARWVWIEAGGDDMTTLRAWGSHAEAWVKELKDEDEPLKTIELISMDQLTTNIKKWVEDQKTNPNS
ncbi:hypothetical protein [Geothrix limicola]|uniref:hypothetical protein n=1 Tax=Geothrix limicola TaxID=2927978 RepID=UPI002552DDFB|nr:hypothetical protein [Geothrix limicola]